LLVGFGAFLKEPSLCSGTGGGGAGAVVTATVTAAVSGDELSPGGFSFS